MKNSTIFKFLSISLLMCPLFSSAMEKESKASDFQIYQLLSCATKNDPEFYLPSELVHAIAITACEITKEERHKEIENKREFIEQLMHHGFTFTEEDKMLAELAPEKEDWLLQMMKK